MRRMLIGIAGLSLIAAAPAPARAQTLDGAARWADSAQHAIEAAIATVNPDRVASARAVAERALAVYAEDPLLLLYRGYALLEEATMRMAIRGSDTSGVSGLLETALDALERSVRRRETPEAHVLMSAVLGIQIGRDPSRGMTLGPRSSVEIDRALDLGPENPRVWLQRGVSAMNTPAQWGGGLEPAERYLLHAVELFEREQAVPPNPMWGRADAQAFLGQVYQRGGRGELARAAYQRALGLEPANPWYRGLLASLDAGH